MKKRALMSVGVVLLAMMLMAPKGGDKGGGKGLKLTDEYISGYFTKSFGDGELVSLQDLSKGGVGFAVSGLGSGIGEKIGISDDFWPGPGLDSSSGCTGEFNSDCSAFPALTLEFKNLGTDPVDVNVYMNTGFTEGGYDTCPGEEYTCDIYYEGSWTTVAPGKSKKVTLDFSNATPYSCDGPLVDGCTNGVDQPIQRLDQVSGIGFQVRDLGGPTSTWVEVKGK